MREHGQRRRAVRAVVAAGAMTVMVMAAGCSTGGESSTAAHSDGTAGSFESTAKAPVGRGMAGSASDGAPGNASGAVGRTVVQTRAVIRKGDVSLVTKEMNHARTQIDDLLAQRGGYVASEDTVNDRVGRPEHSLLVLRVPEPAFDDTMTALTHIGRTERADRSSEDVTTQVIDVNARVATQEASIARLRQFLRQAGTVDDMIRIESEIASREADLESLKAQQKYLTDQASMSTITVRLRTPATPPPPRPAGNRTGFLAGLEDGWHALAHILVGLATVAGALLPFVVVFALLGVPAWLLLRLANRRRHAVTPPATPDPG